MNKQFLPILIIFLIFISIITAIVFASKIAGSQNENQATEAPLLDISDNGEDLKGIAAALKTKEPVAAGQEQIFPGATEIEATQSANPEAAKRVQVTLTNGKSFTLALYPDLAPKTVNNFLNEVREKFYNDKLFFRIEKDPKSGQTILVQTGDPNNNGTGGGIQTAEYNKKPFTAGSVGIARGQNRDKNNDSQFFITTADVLSPNEEYTNFGDVVEGIENVAGIRQGQPILTMKILNE